MQSRVRRLQWIGTLWRPRQDAQAADVVAVLVGDEDGLDVLQSAAQRGEALLDPLRAQTGVDQDADGGRFQIGAVPATAAGEDGEPDHTWFYPLVRKGGSENRAAFQTFSFAPPPFRLILTVPMGGFGLQQNLSLSQTLSPQMQQSLALLQAPALELRSLIQQELEVNPVLEEALEEPKVTESSETPQDEWDKEAAAERQAEQDEDWREYFAQSSKGSTPLHRRGRRTAPLFLRTPRWSTRTWPPTSPPSSPWRARTPRSSPPGTRSSAPWTTTASSPPRWTRYRCRPRCRSRRRSRPWR